MKQTIDKVNELIEYYDLTTRQQTRDIVYKRYFLYNYLRDNTGLTLHTIADMFKRKGNQRHANILNGIGQHKNFQNDDCYKYHTRHLREALKEEVVITKAEERTVIEEVLLCKNYWEMVKLQNKYRNYATID